MSPATLPLLVLALCWLAAFTAVPATFEALFYGSIASLVVEQL